jgi:carbamoyltransferase
MVFCGLKLTHDGAVAVIDNGKLMFCTEMEKINNNKRYSVLDDTDLVEKILTNNGYSKDEIDVFAVDGWGGHDQNLFAIQPGLRVDKEYNILAVKNNGDPYELKIAQYQERHGANVLSESGFNGLKINQSEFAYKSYLHVADHIMSAYATSPFAARGEDAFVLVWDGGMYPLLYVVERSGVKSFGPLFLLVGNIYTIFSQYFGPFKITNGFAKDNLSIAGKVMAYIAYGKPREDLFPYFDSIYEQCYDKPMGFANTFAHTFRNEIASQSISDEDILTSFHVWMERLLVEKLSKKINRISHRSRNLCLAGGCALNIKWNSAIRNSAIFDEVYVPPFPNDSGSAIGAACNAMYSHTGVNCIEWTVYSGPKIEQNGYPTGWLSRKCSIPELAKILYDTNEPVVFLNGNAELGPRALGNRSIIATAVKNEMKDILNRIKLRESYRPVSPICMEEFATDIFSPGTPDPYMLFDHQVRPEWLERIPAICHLDQTARLQTIRRESNSYLYDLLKAYYDISQIPILCNTSANHNGCGFFPSVNSAAKWNSVNYIWCDNTLYFRKEPILF